MLPLLLLVAAASPVRVAAPGFQVVGIDSAVADALQERFVTQLSASGRVSVTTARDISQLLGLERQKQLLGCSDDNGSCLAELAGALGADAVLSGNLVKVGSTYTVTLRFVAGRDGRLLASATDRAKTLDELQDWLDAQAPGLAAKVRAALAPPGEGPPEVGASGPGRSPWPWVSVAGSAVVAGTGLGLFLWGKSDYETLKSGSPTSGQITALEQAGPWKEGSGIALMVTGGLALAGSLVWALLWPEQPTAVSVGVSREGVLVGLVGRWP